ncbi:hypothetical protein [Streptomyces sp. NPDC054765]
MTKASSRQSMFVGRCATALARAWLSTSTPSSIAAAPAASAATKAIFEARLVNLPSRLPIAVIIQARRFLKRASMGASSAPSPIVRKLRRKPKTVARRLAKSSFSICFSASTIWSA